MAKARLATCYAGLEYVADLFSKIHVGFFIALALLHANFWITKLVYRMILCVFHSMLVLHVPSDYVDQVKRYSAWAREWSFTRPSDWVIAYYRYYQMRDRVDVVVAHYKEDLNWLNPYLRKIDHLYLYCKDREDCRKGLPTDLQGANLIIRYLPNEGREANTYLHHIIDHYAFLPDRTVFTLASLNGNWMRKLSFIFALTESARPRKYCYKDSVFEKMRHFQFHANRSTPTSLGDGYSNKARGVTIRLADHQPLEKWMKQYFDKDIYAHRCRYGDGQHGAIFSVSREDIRQYELPRYRKLLLLNSGDDSMEAGYYMERIWRFMFAAKLSA